MPPKTEYDKALLERTLFTTDFIATWQTSQVFTLPT